MLMLKYTICLQHSHCEDSFVELTKLLGMTFTKCDIYYILIRELCCKEECFNIQLTVTHNKAQKLKLSISMETKIIIKKLFPQINMVQFVSSLLMK